MLSSGINTPRPKVSHLCSSIMHYTHFCLRRSLPQAYKPLFSFFFFIIIVSKVEILKEMTNKLKKCYDTKLMVMLINP